MATITMDHLYKNGKPADAKIGDAATILWYSDTTPATIIARTPKSLTVQEDSHKVASGTWPDFTYEYERNPDGVIRKFHWSEKKGWQAEGLRLLVGNRRYYRDPTF